MGHGRSFPQFVGRNPGLLLPSGGNQWLGRGDGLGEIPTGPRATEVRGGRSSPRGALTARIAVDRVVKRRAGVATGPAVRAASASAIRRSQSRQLVGGTGLASRACQV